MSYCMLICLEILHDPQKSFSLTLMKSCAIIRLIFFEARLLAVKWRCLPFLIRIWSFLLFIFTGHTIQYWWIVIILQTIMFKKAFVSTVSLWDIASSPLSRTSHILNSLVSQWLWSFAPYTIVHLAWQYKPFHC